MLTRLRRVLALVAVGGVATLASAALAGPGLQQLYAVTIEATSRENFMQIACGPEAVRSHAVIEMRMGSSTFNLRQEDATECNGLWAPLWAAQPIVLHWAFAVPILFDIGPGSISFSDTDWINGPRRRLTSHFILSESYGRQQRVSKYIPEGYILTLHYGDAGASQSYSREPSGMAGGVNCAPSFDTRRKSRDCVQVRVK